MPLLLEFQTHTKELMSSCRFIKEIKMKMKTPLQNAIMDEGKYEEDDQIHCLEYKGSASFLTLAADEE